METGEVFEGHGYGNSRTGYASPQQPDMMKTSTTDQIQLHYNTAESQVQNNVLPYAQLQKPQPGAQGHPYPDGYKYQQHSSSPGPGRMMQRPLPGGYPPGAMGWPNSSPAASNPNYMPPDRSRYNPRLQYTGYDPSKAYNPMAQHGHPAQGTWPKGQYPQNYHGYTDPTAMSRYSQPDIAGPVVPAGLQALQANNNNATLMQHQHTPMLVPNPHYNQNRVQQPQMAQENKNPNPDTLLIKNEQHTPQRPGATPENMYSPAHSNSSSSSYYPTHSPHHQNVGPIHHQMGFNSPSVSPYPANPTTPASTKSKTRGNKCYQCPKCVKVFRRGDHLKRHLLSVHDHEHPYQCGECGKGFASVPTLLKHAKSLHVGVLTKGLMCLRCHITFATIQEVERHANSLHLQEDEIYMQSINTSSKQHMCSSCTKFFSSATALKRHMQQMHKNKDDRKLYCRECGSSFTKIENLRKHVDKAHNGNPNAMPLPENDVEDADTLSQAHSSESESRALSADTDESSLSAPPSNSQWGYSNPAHPPCENKPGNQVQIATTQNAIPGHPAPSQRQAPVPGPTTTQVQASQQAVTQPQHKPVASQTASPRLERNQTQPIPMQQKTTTPQLTNLTQTPPSQPQLSTSRVNTIQPVPPTARQEFSAIDNLVIEPKSVSECLSMAMKALSDIDYETPGFEMYPFPGGAGVNLAYLQPVLNRNHLHQYPPNMASMRGALSTMSGPRHSPRPPDGNVLMTPNISNDYLNQNGNFLVTMPPPPVTTTSECLPHQPLIAGGQEDPQLSQLLREDGGGVKIPQIIKNNNNSNIVNDNQYVDSPKIKRGRPRKRNYENIEDSGPGSVEEYQQSQSDDSSSSEKVDLVCTVCKIPYESIDHLMSHIEGVHLKMNPNECCICKKHFAQAGNVKRHIRFVHLRERPFRCKNCSCTFDRLCYLQRHMRTHIQPSENNHEFDPLKPCSCPECGKRCLTAHHLRGHMQRKHFAKNKQMYAQFLMKYGHLEAIGAGPGALSPNPSKNRGRKKRKLESDLSIIATAFEASNIPEPMQVSSTPPNSSIETNSLSGISQQIVVPRSRTHQTQQYHFTTQQNSNFNYPAQIETNFPNEFSNYSNTSTVAYNATHKEIQPVSQQFVNQPYCNMMTDEIMPTYNANIPEQDGIYFNDVSVFVEQNLATTTQISKVSKKRHYRTKKECKRLHFRCSHCVLHSFASLEMLKSHLSSKHNKSLRQHVCLKCGESYNKRAHLRSHVIQIHQTNNIAKKRKIKVKRNLADLTQVQSCETPPFILPQGNATVYTPGTASYYTPHNQLYYGYDPNSPAMVPSPNVQMVYTTPTHHASTPLPMVQI